MCLWSKSWVSLSTWPVLNIGQRIAKREHDTPTPANTCQDISSISKNAIARSIWSYYNPFQCLVIVMFLTWIYEPQLLGRPYARLNGLIGNWQTYVQFQRTNAWVNSTNGLGNGQTYVFVEWVGAIRLLVSGRHRLRSSFHVASRPKEIICGSDFRAWRQSSYYGYLPVIDPLHDKFNHENLVKPVKQFMWLSIAYTYALREWAEFSMVNLQ